MKQAASQPHKSTAQRWYQPKRIPLYLAVAGGLVGAATFFWTKQATHPQVETSKHDRKDHVSEEREGAVQAGIDHKESSGRQMTRAMGLHKGMDSDGIFPNEQASKKLGEYLKGDEGKSKK
ncbi:hypothetical protein WJX74_005218 [Apatococcus lobatus]|uniref:Uncharacterized protein n=2 Tax=Apatococcus TaxID=904362 RepID=A0AAW1TCP3_9CHLO